MDEKARRLSVPTTTLEHLSAYPLGCWMTCHAGVENFPARMMDYEEHIERLEEDRLHAEEVAGPYGRSVLLEERAPAWIRLPVPGTAHVFCDATGRHFEAEYRQLRLDPALAPEAVLGGQAPNEGPDLWRNRRAPGPSSRSGTPPPMSSPAPAMPPQHGTGCHD